MGKKHMYRILILIALPLVLSSCTALSETREKKERQIKNVYLPKESKNGTIDFKLYFGNADKSSKGVKPEERSVKREELLGYVLLNELIKGPAIKSDLVPIIPADAKVLSFCVRDRIGYVNLDGGVLNKFNNIDKNQEKNIVTSIVDTVCQLPEIEKVQLMFDNQKKDTLAGNVDISKPLSPDDLK